MANLKECPECGVLIGPTHSHASFCSRYTAPAAVPYGRDGFVRNASGRVAGFAESNIATPVAIALDGWLAAQRVARIDRDDEVVSLRLAGGSYPEIAQATGLSLGAVTRICRAEAA